MNGRSLGRHAHFFGTVKKQGPDIAGFELVASHDFERGFHNGFTIERYVHLVDMRRIEQPVGVFAKSEHGSANFGVVGAFAFKDRQTIMQGMGQDVGGGVAPGHQFSVIPDQAVTIGHRHNALHEKRHHCTKRRMLICACRTTDARHGALTIHDTYDLNMRLAVRDGRPYAKMQRLSKPDEHLHEPAFIISMTESITPDTPAFSDFGLHPNILQAIAATGYTTPTPIQSQAIPVVMDGRDVMGAAQTGTGKTAAFTLPILHRLMAFANTSASPARHPVRALILTPTRELADQVADNVAKYCQGSPLRSAVVFGGVDIGPQRDALRRGCEVLIATPGRLLDHVEQRNV